MTAPKSILLNPAVLKNPATLPKVYAQTISGVAETLRVLSHELDALGVSTSFSFHTSTLIDKAEQIAERLPKITPDMLDQATSLQQNAARFAASADEALAKHIDPSIAMALAKTQAAWKDASIAVILRLNGEELTVDSIEHTAESLGISGRDVYQAILDAGEHSALAPFKEAVSDQYFRDIYIEEPVLRVGEKIAAKALLPLSRYHIAYQDRLAELLSKYERLDADTFIEVTPQLNEDIGMVYEPFHLIHMVRVTEPHSNLWRQRLRIRDIGSLEEELRNAVDTPRERP